MESQTRYLMGISRGTKLIELPKFSKCHLQFMDKQTPDTKQNHYTLPMLMWAIIAQTNSQHNSIKRERPGSKHNIQPFTLSPPLHHFPLTPTYLFPENPEKPQPPTDPFPDKILPYPPTTHLGVLYIRPTLSLQKSLQNISQTGASFVSDAWFSPGYISGSSPVFICWCILRSFRG